MWREVCVWRDLVYDMECVSGGDGGVLRAVGLSSDENVFLVETADGNAQVHGTISCEQGYEIELRVQ